VTGQMSRNEALTRLEELPYDPDTIHHDLEFVATKLRISVADLQGFLAAPNRTHRDYRSQQDVYRIGAKVMRLIGLERGGKR
jgi:hypothetical protein